MRRKAVWGRALRHSLALAVSCFALASVAQAQVRVTVAWDANPDPYTAGYRASVGLASGHYAADLDTRNQASVALDLPQGATYYVVVRAYSHSAEFGPPSAEMVIDLTRAAGTPTNFRASVAGTRATLEWTAPALGIPFDYVLQVGTSPGASDITSGYAVGNVLSVGGNLPQGAYYARLAAVNAMGASPPTPEISFQVNAAETPPGPTGLTTSWQGTVVTISWNAPAGAPPAAYIVDVGSASGAANIAAVNVGNRTSYSVDVPPGIYYVRVRGVSAAGFVSLPSNEVVVQGPGMPGQVWGVAASGAGPSVNLQWRAPSSGAPATSYLLEAGTAAGLSDLASVDVGNVITFSTTVPPGTYYVRVRAVNGRGAGLPSAEIVLRR